MFTETVEWLILRLRRRIIMRSFRGCKASTLPPWLGNRGLVAYCNASLSQTVEELRRAGTDACSKSAHGDTVTGGSISGTFCLKTRDWRPSRGVTTFSAGGSGRPSSKRKDPSFLLGAGWEGGGEDVTVAVWWDFENCNVPLGIEVYKVGVNIVSGLRMCGFKGPVSISAYGDTLQLSRSTQEALASTGIQLHHIPSGGKDSSDRALLVDLILWTFEHPPPAHLFLISGDRDFSNALHRLRMMNYNILLACPAGSIVSPALLGAASQVWQWNSLVRGEGLLSVNPSSDSRPPDGPSGGGIAARQTTQKPYSPSSLHPGSRRPDGNGPLVDVGAKSNPPLPSPPPTIRTKAAAAKAMHNEQQGSNAAADTTRSTKVTIEQEAPKASKPAQKNPDYPSKMSQIPAVGNKEQVNLTEEFEITGSSTELPPETASADRQIPVPQSVEDPNLQPKESESSIKKVVQLSEIRSSPSAQVGKSDQRDSHAVVEKAPSPGLRSFMSKFINVSRWWRKDQVVDTNSNFLPQGSSSTADKTKVGSSDLDQKRIVCSTNSTKLEDREDSIESGGVVANGIWHKPLVNDSKQLFSGGDEGFEENLEAVCDEGASREKSGGQQSAVFVDQAQRKDSKMSWKTWLFGPTQEKSASSVTGRPTTDSSKSPAVYDLTDLDKATWKELLSWPGKLTQISTGSKSEVNANALHHAVIGHEDEAQMWSNTSSSPTEGHKLKEEKASSGYVLNDLKDYLRTPEGTAILSEARNLMAVVDILKTTGPDKFRVLQSSQIADLIDQLEMTEECSNYQHLTPIAHSVRASDEGVADQLRTRHAGQSTEIVGQQVIHSIDESSLPKEPGKNVKPRFQDEESPNGSMHDELLSKHSVDFRSLCNNGISILKQEDQIGCLEDDSVPLRDPNAIEDSSLSAKLFPTTSFSKTEATGPSLGEFQEWFLETVKEAYKSSERTRRIGFDLSLVKPDFERKFRVRLDPRVYGFVKLQDLLASISAVRVTRPRNDMCVVYLLKEGAILEEDQRREITVSALKASRWPQMYHDCKSLVRELMLENPEGLPGTKLKPLFISRFQYPLDHKHVGYQKMSDLLRLMPDVVSVSGKYLIPSEELLLSLKNEARGEEIEVNREAIVEEDNVPGDSYSQSRQDANLEKVGFESTEGWGEIDTEGNGNSSPSAYIIEDTREEVPGLQDEHSYRSSVIEKVPFTENVAAQDLVSAETNSEGETENLQRPIFSAEIQGPSVEEFRPELLNTGPQRNHKGRYNEPLDSCLLHGEPLVNAINVNCEEDKVASDGQEPPESREGLQSFPSEGDKDTCKKEELFFVEKNEDGSVHRGDEDLDPRPATVILEDSNGDVKEEQIMGSLGAPGNMDRETAAENPPSSLYNTSADVVLVGLDKEADFRQTQEFEVSQTRERSEGIDETSNTRNISSGLELVNQTSIEKHTCNNKSIIDFEESTGHKTSDTVLKAGPSTDKNSPNETTNLEDSANTSPGSLREDRKKGFEGLMGDDPLDKELKTSSSIEECQTSAGVSNHDEGRPPTAGEATHEASKEGHPSGSVSSDGPSLKSIWKRLFF